MKAFGPDARANTRYFDTDQQCQAIKLLPNEYYVTGKGEDSLMLSTVLGSCVAACVHDPVSNVGGMNHFMLPGEATGASPDSMRYGSYAMEVLINEILKAGGLRERLRAKVFGGGAVLGRMTHLAIGDGNSSFILEYLRRENIAIAAQDLRGPHPRRVNYFPSNGRAMVRKLGREGQGQVVEQEDALRSFLVATPGRSRVERLQPRRQPPAPAPVSEVQQETTR